MMVEPNYINPRISKYTSLIFISLLFVLLTAMAQFASFALIQHDVISFFGAQPEDISLALQMTYVGILATLPLQFRTLKRFDTRNYLLVALTMGILLNLGCLYTESLILFTILRFFVGATTAIIAGSMLMVIFSILPEKKSMVVGVFAFFGSILSIGVIVGTAAAWAVERMDWNGLYYILISLQVISIMICFLVFKENTLPRKIPLYQLDYIGYILFVCFGVLFAYTLIYGPKYYWFEDSTIRTTAIGALVFLSLFLYHQKRLKRPSVDLRALNYKRFWFGLLLLIFFYGIKDTINLLYGYAAGILGWSSEDIVSLGLFNVLGVALATFLALKVILTKKQNLPKLLLAGFFILLYYHLWIYWNLTPDLSYTDLVFPIFIQGFASGLLFAPIIMLCMSSLPSYTGMTGIIICAYGRFTASLNSIAGFYTLQEHYNQKYKIGFIESITPFNLELHQRSQEYENLLVSKGYNPESASAITSKLVGKTIGIQSQLLTDRTIFILAVYLTVLAILSLIVFGLVNRYKSKKQVPKIVS